MQNNIPSISHQYPTPYEVVGIPSWAFCSLALIQPHFVSVSPNPAYIINYQKYQHPSIQKISNLVSSSSLFKHSWDFITQSYNVHKSLIRRYIVYKANENWIHKNMTITDDREVCKVHNIHVHNWPCPMPNCLFRSGLGSSLGSVWTILDNNSGLGVYLLHCWMSYVIAY